MLKKSRCSATIEAAMPNIRDLSDPEFVPIRARLARAYLELKGDLGVLLAALPLYSRRLIAP